MLVKTFSGRNIVDNGRYFAGNVDLMSGFQAPAVFSFTELIVLHLNPVRYCTAPLRSGYNPGIAGRGYRPWIPEP